ncbi:MAG: DUF2063 domain-containing protein [Gammaproteobacteria bacterium]
MSHLSAAIRQQAFAAHLRDPDRHAPPADMDPARVGVYRDLFFNNVEGLLASFFPVLRSLCGREDWLALARAFYAQHRARAPYFLEIAGEFVEFLESTHAPRPTDPPFLRELAHYEWLELALDVADEELPSAGIDANGDLLRGVPVVNPLAVLARYDWPVHRISASSPRTAASETWLLVWRDRGDKVRFQELNSLSAQLFTRLRENAESATRLSGAAVVGMLAKSLPTLADDRVAAGARQLLEAWRERDVLLGVATG